MHLPEKVLQRFYAVRRIIVGMSWVPVQLVIASMSIINQVFTEEKRKAKKREKETLEALM